MDAEDVTRCTCIPPGGSYESYEGPHVDCPEHGQGAMWTYRPLAVLAAFRAVTAWTDEQVIHYATCDVCTPICGHEEHDCAESPASIALNNRIAARDSSGPGAQP